MHYYEEEVTLLKEMGNSLKELKEYDERFYLHIPTKTKLQSVTTYLNVLNHPGLDKWKEKQLSMAWLKTLQNPKWNNFDSNSINLNNILQEVLDLYEHNTGYGARLGKAIHKYIEYEINYYINGTLIDFDTDGEISKEFDIDVLEKESNQFMDWLEHKKYTPIMSECTIANLCNQPLNYAGTIDLLVIDNNNNLRVMDIKTGKGIYAQYFYQLAAYRDAVWQIICDITDINKKDIISSILQVRDGKTLQYNDPTPDKSFDTFNKCIYLKNNVANNNQLLYKMLRAQTN